MVKRMICGGSLSMAAEALVGYLSEKGLPHMFSLLTDAFQGASLFLVWKVPPDPWVIYYGLWRWTSRKLMALETCCKEPDQRELQLQTVKHFAALRVCLSPFPLSFHLNCLILQVNRAFLFEDLNIFCPLNQTPNWFFSFWSLRAQCLSCIYRRCLLCGINHHQFQSAETSGLQGNPNVGNEAVNIPESCKRSWVKQGFVEWEERWLTQ